MLIAIKNVEYITTKKRKSLNHNYYKLTKAFKEIEGYQMKPFSDSIKQNKTLYIIAHHC